MADLIVKSKIKDFTELNVSGDVAEKLDVLVKDMIAKATERALANGRRTVQSKDL